MRSVVSAWVPLWHTSITRDPFYQWCLGLEPAISSSRKDGSGNFIFIVMITVIYALAFPVRDGIKVQMGETVLDGSAVC